MEGNSTADDINVEDIEYEMKTMKALEGIIPQLPIEKELKEKQQRGETLTTEEEDRLVTMEVFWKLLARSSTAGNEDTNIPPFPKNALTASAEISPENTGEGPLHAPGDESTQGGPPHERRASVASGEGSALEEHTREVPLVAPGAESTQGGPPHERRASVASGEDRDRPHND